MAVSFFIPADPQAPYKTPEDLVEAIQSGPITERVRRAGTVSLDGREAMEILFDGFYPPPHSVREEDNVPDTRWIVLVPESDYIFQLDYGAAREDFDKHAPAFERMVQTFRFQRE